MRRTSIVGLLDQIAYSATNLLLTVLVARSSPAAAFGQFSIIIATFLIASGTHRGIVAEPLVLGFSGSAASVWQQAVAKCLQRSILVGLSSSAALIVLTLSTARGEISSEVGVAIAIATPFAFLQDFFRFLGFGQFRPKAALANDLVSLAVQCVCAVLTHFLGGASVWYAVGWGLGSIAGLCAGLAILRPRIGLRNAPAAQSVHLSLSFRLGLDNFLAQLTQQASAYIVAGVAGLAATAGLRTAQTIFTPPAVVTQGMQSALAPALVVHARRDPRSLLLSLRQIGAFLIGLTVLFGIAIAWLPTVIGTAIFGESWLSGRHLVVLIGVGIVFGVVANMAVLGLRAMTDASTTLLARALTASASLAAVALGAALDGARGAAFAIACAGLVQAITWLYFFRRSYVRYLHTHTSTHSTNAEGPLA